MSTKTLEFVEKSAEELEKMDANQLADYLNQKSEHNQKSLEAKIEAKASKEDIDALKNEIVDENVKQLSVIRAALKDQSKAINDIRVKPTPKPTTFKGLVAEEMKKAEQSGQLKSLKDQGGWMNFDVKAPADMTFGNVISGGADIPQAYRTPGIGMIPQRQTRITQLLNQIPLSEGNTVDWVYELNQEGDAAFIAEATTKPLIDAQLAKGSQTVEKVAARKRVSHEIMRDIPRFSSYCDTRIRTAVERIEEAGVYNGNGTSPNLQGIRGVSTAFAAGGSAVSIDEANIVSVVGAAIVQIQEANQDFPNAVLMHPRDMYELGEIKVSASDRRYIGIPALSMQNGIYYIHGVPVVQSTLVTQDEYLVGAFNRADLYVREGLTIRVGYSGNDFAENMLTIIGEKFVSCVVEHEFRTAFVAGTLSTDQTALETV